MQIDWFAFSLWVMFFLVGVLVGLVVGYFMGLEKGAKNYFMITKYLREVLDKREDADVELEIIRNTINAIKEGSE